MKGDFYMRNSVKDSIQTLEFPKVKKQLQGLTVSSLAKKHAGNIKPSADKALVQKWQDETEDAAKLLRMKGGLPIAAFEDIKPHLKRLTIGGVLSEGEIVDIARVIKNSRELKQFFSQLKEEAIELKRLYQLNDALYSLQSLERKIREVIDESGTVSDDASPKLRGIRTGIKQTEQSIRDKLDRIVRGKQSRYLTDSIITIRNNRYVIPVKADSRSVFGGVVHDQSSTGQTLFIEPQSVLNLNNKLKQYRSEEQAEIDRILAELSELIAPHTNEIEANLRRLVQFDFIQAKATYAKQLDASRPEISENLSVSLIGARHPLIKADEVVANDIIIGEDYKAIVVTGPNTGGKTVILKTLGLMQLMGQAGLHIPAEQGSVIGLFTKWFADIGDEQSIEQSLSTFSSHMTNIVSILNQLDEKSLILLDELGAGTDPQEGAALAIAMLDYIASQGSTVMITSHYPELKVYGYNRPQTINASMEFDVDSLSPTYRLLLGVPGRSNAFEIARRLGLSEHIIASSQQLMSGESQSVDNMIGDLEQKRKEAEKQNKQLKQELYQATQLHNELKDFYASYEKHKDHLEQKAQEEANEIIQEAQKEADRIIEELRHRQLEGEQAPNVKEHEFIDAKSRLSNLHYEQEHLKQNKVLQKEKQKKELAAGDEVHVLSFDQPGILVEQTDEKEWVVQMGMLKMKIDESELKVKETKEKAKQPKTTVRASKSSIRTEVDLRGQRVHEAVKSLEQYIDQALLANYHQVTIIHGMGTGAVRKAVHKRLREHPRVASFNDAPANQGGNGATIVTFK